MSAEPTRFIHDCPARNTPVFWGQCIDMVRLSESGFDYTYLSKIFSGKAVPGPSYARRLADKLGMTLAGFYLACDALNQ